MSWKKVRIADFTEVITGGTPSTANKKYWDSGNIPWLNSGDLNQDIITEAHNFITSSGLENSAAKMMPEDTVLIALTGATTGVVGYLTFSASANQSVTGILPSDSHHPKYLYYYLKSIREKVVDDSYGGAQKHISQGYVKDLQIPLPPLATQKRIAEILDAADALRRKDQELLKKYDGLGQAIFIDMFGDPVKNEKGWEVKKLKDLSHKITDGEHLNPKFITKGMPLIMAKDIKSNGVDFSNYKCVSEIDFVRFTKKCNPQNGDLIIVSRGATIGRSCVVDTTREFCLMGSTILLKPNNLLLSDYLHQLFTIENFKRRLVNVSSASAQQAIYISNINELTVPTPPMLIQLEYSKRLKVIKEQLNIFSEENNQTISLFNSLLQKAFKGELVA